MTIRIIDLETTGFDSTAHVVEVGSVDLLPDGSIRRFRECSVLQLKRRLSGIDNQTVILLIKYSKNHCAYTCHCGGYDYPNAYSRYYNHYDKVGG